MRWPWVSAARLDDKDAQIARLEMHLADSERERKRLTDLIFRQQFGVQVHDTIAEPAAETPQPEVPLTPEEELQRAKDDVTNKLRSLARGPASNLGPAIARLRSRQQADAVRNAGPEAHEHPAQQVFGRIREEVEGTERLEVEAQPPTNGNGRH